MRFGFSRHRQSLTHLPGIMILSEGKTGVALKKAVKAIVRKHTVISYDDATRNAFRKTDVRVVNGKECWWDMYSSNNIAVSSGHPGMNIEHSVANSRWGGTKNDAYKDIVHLNPSDKDGNSRKSNYPLTELSKCSLDKRSCQCGVSEVRSGWRKQQRF